MSTQQQERLKTEPEERILVRHCIRPRRNDERRTGFGARSSPFIELYWEAGQSNGSGKGCSLFNSPYLLCTDSSLYPH